MDEKVMSQLDVELAHAGEGTTLSPKMLLLEKMRITPEKQLEPMEFLFRLFGKPCFPRRELVAITGKAKSGKTFVTSMLMACCITRKVLALERHTDKNGHTDHTDLTDFKPLRALWYDTEQSDESTQDILKNRIVPMMIKTHPQPLPMMEGSGYLQGQNQMDDLFTPRPNREGLGVGLFDVFNVRGVEWKERRPLLAEAIHHYRPDLVIVDGIRDLVNDINDGVLAQEVMEELLHLATQQNCCIVCVLHQNKGSEDHNLRGWIGTELMNKAFEVYACEKMMPQRVFKVEQTLTRKYDIEQTLYFEVDEQGLPKASAPPSSKGGGEQCCTDRQPPLNREYIVQDDNDEDGWHVDLRRLIGDVMAGRDQITGQELKEQMCQLARISSWKFYNKLLAEAVSSRIIMKSYDHVGRVIYAMSPF
jgi:hypothetical protein